MGHKSLPSCLRKHSSLDERLAYVLSDYLSEFPHAQDAIQRTRHLTPEDMAKLADTDRQGRSSSSLGKAHERTT